MRGKYKQALKNCNKLFANKVFIAAISLLLLFSISFFIGSRFSKNKISAVAVNANSENLEKQNKDYEQWENHNTIIEQSMLNKKLTMGLNKRKKESETNSGKPQKNVYTDPLYVPDGTKVAYLTFDDGPSHNVTPKVLEVLKQYDVKATFFVIGKLAVSNREIILRAKSDGHAVANHTYSHEYSYIYGNTQNLLDDFAKGENVLKSLISDYSSKIVRFPGGSYGSKNEPFRQAVTKAGYRYVDWNALNSDADANQIPKGSYSLPAERLVSNLKQSCAGKQHVVILMHDAPAKMTTAEALPQIIEFLKAQGYIFKTLE